RDLSTRLFRHELVALAEAHHVDVVLREQTYARLRGRKVGVAEEDERGVSVDVDRFELVPDRVEESSRVGRRELPRREPFAEILRRRRAIRAQVPAADLAQCFLLVHFFPLFDPLIRTGERDLASLRRPLTEIGTA